MKVCTDACIFGSWIADKNLQIKNCLDIGSGTGLLSLMFAQKDLFADIDAVDLEENASIQTKENFENSQWSKRLKVFNADIKNFVSQKKYDLIISNPPFYENDLLSEQKNKNIAKHDAGLSLTDLIIIIKKNLTKNGHFAILLPYHRIEYFEDLAEENFFFVKEKLLIKQTPKHNFFRGILLFSRIQSSFSTTELTIKNKEGNYTKEFLELLKDYYLHL